MAEYSTYPMKVMKITQTYNGTTSHKPHTTGSPKDYPIDDGGSDTGKDNVYATTELKVVKIYGVGNRGTNTIWLTTTNKVSMPNGKTDYLTFLITHPDDANLKHLKVGDIIKKGTAFTKEGIDGATGNHCHFAVGIGNMSGTGWTQNSNGKWVLTTTGGAIKPEDAWYIDPKFTTIKSSNGIKFKEVPKTKTTEVKETASYTKYKTIENLRCRKSPVNGEVLKVYSKGTEIKVYKTQNGWGKTSDGWVSLEYCKKI